MKQAILLIFLLFILMACQSPETSKIESLLGPEFSKEHLDQFIDQEMKNLNMPGLSIAIINDGEVVYHEMRGYADKEKEILLNENTIFEGASISKSVFGHFVMTFVEEGKLDLDKPLFEYLPYPDIAHDDRYRKITARMVLSHRTGFPNWRDDYEDNQLFIQFEPDTDYHYSGEGYQYLALVLKHLLSTNWAGLEEEFQKRVAIPLQMQHTVYIQNDLIRSKKATPYDKKGNPIDKSELPWWQERDSVFVAPTTIHSESLDFSKWVIAMMNEEGLSSESFKTLYQTHSEISGGRFFKSDYTLGFGKTTLLGARTFYSHNGNNTGFSSLFMFDKEKKWGLIYFTNSEFGDAFGDKLIYGFLLTGWSGRKQLVLGVLFGLSLLTFLINTILYFQQESNYRSIGRKNLLAALLIFVSLILLFSLMFYAVTPLSFIYLSGLVLFAMVLWLLITGLKDLVSVSQNSGGLRTGGIYHGIIAVVLIGLVVLVVLS